MRVLYVEDDAALAADYADAMRARAMEVKVLTSASAALAFAPTDPKFDALVIDIAMDRGHYAEFESSGGRMTGIRLTEDIVTYYPMAAVIALTRSRDPHVKNFFDREFYGYARRVDKPAAWMLSPYVLWVLFASVLNAEIVRRN